MTLAEDALVDVYEGRGIAGEEGFRPHRVYRLTRYKSGSVRNTVGDEEIEITEGGGYPPRVRWKTHEEIAVGSLAKGAAEIGAITPNDELDAWLRAEGMSGGDDSCS